MQKFWTDLSCLWQEQMAEVRVNWMWYTLFSVLLPIILVFGFTRIGAGLIDSTSLLYIISGSMILSLASDGIYGMAIKIGEMKQENTLIYYMSLPISRFAFILALIASRLIVTIPGMVVPLLYGVIFYNFDVHLSLWLLILIPSISISFAILGLVIGVWIKSLNLIQLIVNALLFVILLASPIFMPLESLPLPLQITSFFMPMTYASSALRDAIVGDFGSGFYLNMAIVILTAVIALIFLTRYWKWREA